MEATTNDLPIPSSADSLRDVTEPASLDQLFQIAVREHQAGGIAQAAELYRRILVRNPNHGDALNLLGVTEHQSGRTGSAIELISRAVAIEPRSAQYRSNLGEVLRQAKQVREAIAMLHSAVELDPNSSAAMTNLGLAYQQAEQLDPAEFYLRSVLAIKPTSIPAMMGLAKVMSNKFKLDEAMELARGVLAVAPELVDARNTLGITLCMGGHVAEAVEMLRACTVTEPRNEGVWTNLGLALLDLGDAAGAFEAQTNATQLDPLNPILGVSRLFTTHYVAGLDPRQIFAEHRAWGERHADPITRTAPPCANDRDASRKLRIGYVSADLRSHPVAHFLLPILRKHDRTQFEVFCYSNTLPRDAVTERIRLSCDHWREIRGANDDEAARLIREDRIDVLIDLSGHTGSTRLMVFAHKPAPMQMTWLGYPDTTGMRAIDYRITDAIADPPGLSDELHVEQLIRLNASFLCYAPIENCPPIVERDDAAPITFGSFNRPAKISPMTLDLWSRVLNECAGSRLIVKGPNLNDDATVNVWRKRFTERGIDTGRIEFIGPTPSIAEHLAIYGRVDVALDTYPYTGTTTTCESLWMGVPVVTLVGEAHVSRVGLSLLSSVGLEDLTAGSADEYVRKAVALAGDGDRRVELRRTLRDRLRASPLLDANAMTQKLESSYRTAWRKWCESTPD